MELLKLLIADECDEFRQALAETLGKTYLVRTCRSGTQALELLQSFRPEVLVTDLMLSHLDGLTVLQQAVTGSKTALKDAATTLYTIRPTEE